MYSFDHPVGIKVPKFVTVVVKPNEQFGDDVDIKCFMVSDQC